MRASANVIHPRSPDGNADKERASAASVVPSSFLASGGAAASAPNSQLMRLIIPILKVSCCAGAASGIVTAKSIAAEGSRHLAFRGIDALVRLSRRRIAYSARMNSQSGNDIDFNVGIAGYGTL